VEEPLFSLVVAECTNGVRTLVSCGVRILRTSAIERSSTASVSLYLS